jgi:hypothetical protein
VHLGEADGHSARVELRLFNANVESSRVTPTFLGSVRSS